MPTQVVCSMCLRFKRRAVAPVSHSLGLANIAFGVLRTGQSNSTWSPHFVFLGLPSYDTANILSRRLRRVGGHAILGRRSSFASSISVIAKRKTDRPAFHCIEEEETQPPTPEHFLAFLVAMDTMGSDVTTSDVSMFVMLHRQPSLHAPLFYPPLGSLFHCGRHPNQQRLAFMGSPNRITKSFWSL